MTALATDPRHQYDYAVEGPRQSQLWPHRYLLFLQDVTAVFDGFKALDIEDLGVGHNELRVVVGPNGAGKTTMCDVISGMTKPTTGHVFFDGAEITGINEAAIAQGGVGRKFQIPNVFNSLTVMENMAIALPDPDSDWDIIADRLRRGRPQMAGPGGVFMMRATHGVFRSLFGRVSREQRECIESILERVKLIDQRDELARNLSHGQRQWLAISSLILAGPKLLLVDEPAAGLTDSETALTAELLLELKNEHTIICIEHDMEFVRMLDARVTVLNEGRVLAEGTIDQVQADEAVIEAYLGR